MGEVKYTLGELIDKLPSNWDEFKLSQYKRMGGLFISDEAGDDSIFNGVENSISMLSVLLDISPEALKSLPFWVLTRLSDRLSFTLTAPVPKDESKYNWKGVDEITTSDLLIMLKLGNDLFVNSHEIIKSFCKDNLNDKQIDDMPVSEVVTGFFFLQMSVKKSMEDIQKSLLKRIVILMAKEKIKKLQLFKQTKKK